MSHSSWDIKNIFRKVAKFQFYSVKISVIFLMFLVNYTRLFSPVLKEVLILIIVAFCPHGCSLWIHSRPCDVKERKKSQFTLTSRREFTLTHFYISIFSVIFTFVWEITLRAGTTVSLLHLMPVVHAEWIDCDGLLRFNNLGKQMEIFTLRPNKRWWMRTSVEMEVSCPFLGHSKVLSDPWEYDEKAGKQLHGNTCFSK